MVDRFYDPTTGQFLTRDPLNAMTRSAYGYVNGNPLNMTDPSGLAPWDDWCIMGVNCDEGAQSIAQMNPEVSQGVADFAGGALEMNPVFQAVSFGAGRFGVDIDVDSRVNVGTGWYKAGGLSMLAADLALGGIGTGGTKLGEVSSYGARGCDAAGDFLKAADLAPGRWVVEGGPGLSSFLRTTQPRNAIGNVATGSVFYERAPGVAGWLKAAWLGHYQVRWPL